MTDEHEHKHDETPIDPEAVEDLAPTGDEDVSGGATMVEQPTQPNEITATWGG
jgi:hypothetical protein